MEMAGEMNAGIGHEDLAREFGAAAAEEEEGDHDEDEDDD